MTDNQSATSKKQIIAVWAGWSVTKEYTPEEQAGQPPLREIVTGLSLDVTNQLVRDFSVNPPSFRRALPIPAYPENSTLADMPNDTPLVVLVSHPRSFTENVKQSIHQQRDTLSEIREMMAQLQQQNDKKMEGMQKTMSETIDKKERQNNSKMEELRKTLNREHDKKIEELQKTMNETIDKKERQNSTKMEELRKALNREHDKKIEELQKTLNGQRDKKIEEIRKAMNQRINEKERQNNKKMEDMRETIDGQHDKKMEEMRRTINGQHDRKIEKMERQHEEEIDSLKNDLKDTKQKTTQLERNLADLRTSHEQLRRSIFYLHLRYLLDQARSKIAAEFEKKTWDSLLKTYPDKPALVGHIYSHFANSSTALSDKCIRLLCYPSDIRDEGDHTAHSATKDEVLLAIMELQVRNHRAELAMLFHYVFGDHLAV